MHQIPYDIIVTILVTVLASSGFWSLIRYRMTAKDKRKTALEQAVVALLHDRIYNSCEAYIERDSITFREFDNLQYLYNSYTALGGNSTGTALFEDVRNLPKKASKAEAQNTDNEIKLAENAK